MPHAQNVSNITSEALSNVHTRVLRIAETRRVISILYPRLRLVPGSPFRYPFLPCHPRCFPSPDGLIHNLYTTAARSPPLASSFSSSLLAARRRVSQVCTCVDEPNLNRLPAWRERAPTPSPKLLTVKRPRRARVGFDRI